MLFDIVAALLILGEALLGRKRGLARELSGWRLLSAAGSGALLCAPAAGRLLGRIPAAAALGGRADAFLSVIFSPAGMAPPFGALSAAAAVFSFLLWATLLGLAARRASGIRLTPGKAVLLGLGGFAAGAAAAFFPLYLIRLALRTAAVLPGWAV